MVGKIAAAAVVAFWAIMMVALVRMEYLRVLTGTEVPAELVLRKVFSQETPARLNVLHEGQVIGFCKIDIDQPVAASNAGTGTNAVVRQARMPYQAHSELTLALANFGIPSRLRVVSHAQFNPQFGIDSYKILATIGDGHIDLRGDSASRKLLVDFSIGDFHDRRTFDYDQLQGAGLQNLIGAAGLANMGWLSGAGLGDVVPKTPIATAPAGKKLTTVHTSQLRIAGEAEETYLIESRADESLWLRIWVSKQGEILKVESSAHVVLLADTLTELGSRYTDVEHDSH